MTALQRLLACLPRHLHRQARSLAAALDPTSALAVADLLDESGENALVNNDAVLNHRGDWVPAHTAYVLCASEAIRWRLYGQWQAAFVAAFREAYIRWPYRGKKYAMRQIPSVLRRLQVDLPFLPGEPDVRALFEISAIRPSVYIRAYRMGSTLFESRCLDRPDYIRGKVRDMVDHLLARRATWTRDGERIPSAVTVEDGWTIGAIPSNA